MYALAYRLMGARDADAADVLQEAWLRAIPRLSDFRRESSLRTWLCGFIVNCCRERFRGPLFEDVDDELSVSSVGSGELRVLGTIDLERALASLPPGARTVVILHDIEGYTHREIGWRSASMKGRQRASCRGAGRRCAAGWRERRLME